MKPPDYLVFRSLRDFLKARFDRGSLLFAITPCLPHGPEGHPPPLQWYHKLELTLEWHCVWQVGTRPAPCFSNNLLNFSSCTALHLTAVMDYALTAWAQSPRTLTYNSHTFSFLLMAEWQRPDRNWCIQLFLLQVTLKMDDTTLYFQHLWANAKYFLCFTILVADPTYVCTKAAVVIPSRHASVSKSYAMIPYIQGISESD